MSPANGRSPNLLPWALVAGLLLLTLALMPAGWWRGAGTGPQVQAPMFYDAHYLYPRPWTQEQAAPGVPDPSPVAFYGANQLSQQFVAASDRLAQVSVWLAGPPGTPVDVTLADDRGVAFTGQIRLGADESGANYHLALPPQRDSDGRAYRLTLTAPSATAAAPVIGRTVGGDRLGASVRLNEYLRPGNLELVTAARRWPGRWWLESVAEQLLPSVFRLRVQQYKPELFKGPAFAAALSLVAILTLAFFILARPAQLPWIAFGGWTLAALLAAFLVWQLAGGRLRLPGLTEQVTLTHTPVAEQALPVPGEVRLVHDLSLLLWTAERAPEPRFVSTGIADGRPYIDVPGDSALRYGLTIPPGSRLRAGFDVADEGALWASVLFDDELLAEQVIASGEEPAELDVDLALLGGRTGTLRLETQAVRGAPHGRWLMPQIATTGPWLADAADVPDGLLTGYRFGEAVELLGVGLDPAEPPAGSVLTASLFWRAAAGVEAYPTVFVHLLDAGGRIVAQSDAPPVGGSYPVADWPVGAIVRDDHALQLPAGRGVEPGDALAVGLYDPATGERWPVYDAAGNRQPDDGALRPLP